MKAAERSLETVGKRAKFYHDTLNDKIEIKNDKNEIKSYLEECIVHWRKKKAIGCEYALYYIDAYQSVYSSIFGKLY